MHEFRNIALILSVFAPLNWIIIFLLNSKVKSAAKNHLTVLYGLSTIVFIVTYAKYNGHIMFFSFMFPLHAFSILMVFPLFYLYIRILTSEDYIYNFNYYIHFIIPGLIFLIYFFISNVWMSADENILFMQNVLKSVCLPGFKFQFAYYSYFVGKIIYLIISILYFFLIYAKYSSFKKKIIDFFPDNPSKELSWLRIISNFFLVLVIFNIAIHYIRDNYLFLNDTLVGISYFVFSFFVWILGFYGNRQSDVFSIDDIKKTQTFQTDKKISKIEIEQYMVNEKPYLNKDLSIYDFCYKFQSNRTYISAIINRNFNMNFKTFINSYRIDNAKEQIKELKLSNTSPYFDQIAIDSGFSTYGSFLRVFKVTEGITPTEYYKNLII